MENILPMLALIACTDGYQCDVQGDYRDIALFPMPDWATCLEAASSGNFSPPSPGGKSRQDFVLLTVCVGRETNNVAE